jgi:tetratricopeptide (TPR) repeat protein
LSIKEIGLGIGFLILLGIAGAVGAGAGFLITYGLERLLAGLGYEAENLPLLGVAIGGLIGFLGLYVYTAATQKSWRWLWASWIGLGAVAVLVVLALNAQGLGFDAYLDPIREIPFVSQLSRITITEGGTGKVRVLIWDAVLELIVPHEPLGIQGDAVATREDSFINLLRPLIGYGPESMFNAFAYVYPPDLAHVEARGSSADRSHNETMDSLVITGILGFLAFYFLMISIFYYLMYWLGWAPDKLAQYRLITLLIAGGLIGAVIPYLADGRLTFIALGLPFGLVAGMMLHVIWQSVVRQPAANNGPYSVYTLLMIGGLGAIVGHFIEVHFVFSIAATYTYFWVYAGLLVALARLKEAELAPQPEIPVPQPTTLAESQDSSPPLTTRRGKKRRGRRVNNLPANQPIGPTYALSSARESWDTWVGSQGLAMAIILIILTFDFVTPQFFQNTGNNENVKVFWWMLLITWLVCFAITLATLALRFADWYGGVNWIWAIVIYAVTSFFYFGFHLLAHQLQLGQQVFVQASQNVLKAANVLTGGLVVFYIFLLLLLVILALTLSWRKTRHLAFWRVENWWLYPPLVLVTLALIWFKNIDVVRADVYLKEGERYRNNQQWDQAVLLHQKAISIDSDEDFYYLMLALDYQLKAQDNRLDQATRAEAWQLGEQTALDARKINPYNPDNTGNMGRYYFTLGQVLSRERFHDALDFFEKATKLAPSNVIYHNLWAQTNYILQDYPKAVDRLQTSVTIDPNYAPTWLLLGDTYAAMGEVDKAWQAHTATIKLNSQGSTDGFNAFADQFLDQRLNFYISGGRVDDLIAALQQLAEARPAEGKIPWVIGRIYQLQGQMENATPYFEEARAMGDNSDRTARELANLYLSQGDYQQAEPLYQQLLQANPNDFESHSALAYLYAQQGRLDEAIQHNQAVLQQLPQDYDSLKNMAILYQQQGQYSEALNYAQQAKAVASDADKASWDQFIANLETLLSNENP